MMNFLPKFAGPKPNTFLGFFSPLIQAVSATATVSLFSTTAILLTAGDAFAASFTFTTIADQATSGLRLGGSTGISMNDYGTVAFHTGNNSNGAVYTSDGSTFTLIAETGQNVGGQTLGSLLQGSPKVINNNGEVAFVAARGGQGALLVGNGTDIRVEAVSSNSQNIGVNPFYIALNDSSELAYIFGPGSNPGIVRPNGSPIPSGAFRYTPLAMNNNGDVYTYNNGGTSNVKTISVWKGNEETIIADTFGEFALLGISGNRSTGFTLNEDGSVFFSASLDSSANPGSYTQILKGNGSTLEKLLDAETSPFNAFGNIVSANNNGEYAFFGFSPTLGNGIFVGTGSDFKKVVAEGDILPGFGGVARLQPIFQINEAGQIVFRATSQGGNGPGNAILRADPVIDSTPVPTPALLPGLVGMGVAALRKRKQETELEA